MMRSRGAWETSVFHDLETLLDAWKRRRDPESTAIVHIGFDRSPARVFDAFVDQFPGKVLLTSAAKFALPDQFLSTESSVARCLAGQVYLATLGWGYDATDYEPQGNLTETGSLELEGWVRDYAAANPGTKDDLLGAGVLGEASYLEQEAELPHELRHKLGVYRFRSFCTQIDDPGSIASAAPPWLRNREFEKLPLTVRLANILGDLQVKKVSDLERFTTSDLLRAQNCGRKSIRDLVETLESALDAGPVDSDKEFFAVEKIGLISAVRRSLLLCGERERDILTSRMGLDNSPETLHEIGLRYNVTRERIRQIESKTLSRLLASEMWSKLLASKLRKQIAARDYPLPLRGIEAVDPWFAEVGEKPNVIRYLLSAVSDAGVQMVEIDELEYLALVDQPKWETTVRSAKRLLASSVENNLTEAACQHLVEGLLPEQAREFRGLLWAKASKLCHFVMRDGSKYLRQYGRGAEQVVETVLEESDTPLHFSQIALRSSVRARKEIDSRRAHNAAASVGLLFSRGTYGLRKHIPLDTDQMQIIVEIAEDIVNQSDIDRQWHCAELTLAVTERVERSLVFDQYIMEIALRSSGNLKRHGRLVWSRSSIGDDAMRIDIRQAIIATLQNAGRPLRATDIRQRLVAVRGLSQSFQIVQQDPLLKVGPATWGLNDRDMPIKRDKQQLLSDDFVRALEERQVGIHITEIVNFVDAPPNVASEALFSIATLDSRLRVNVGQYIFLAAWGEARRQNIHEAVLSTLSTQYASFNAIVKGVAEAIGRPVDRRVVSASLQSSGAEFDGNESWRLSSGNGVQEEDDEIDAQSESQAA
ncbi:sigma factor-like helix-turn-helix DNA-binding protein [Bosea sp. (in: a-proteobacteria)]|uniref:sigma factor-like helix-turn-helix DNA-binding protein n=1 Tax=Bosea sp. (in: a-proteobacteria) TaxID=1871050 RepID=UPI0027325985|nr:sigma factor-like helix-turn-helix DNA-binding protein [Bosea sp. (in: a-proteobacteria)]MDP3410806.1 sigma factor-like helix-turn-helix DNA-binding protein [Bosea sp. (in: a-proteobacteria)]